MSGKSDHRCVGNNGRGNTNCKVAGSERRAGIALPPLQLYNTIICRTPRLISANDALFLILSKIS